MTLRKLAELISLALTIPTIALGLKVVWNWARHVKRCPQTPIDWFILGVFISFLGSSLDNFYWFLPWTASYLDLGVKAALVDHGVYFNIVSRQLAGVTAAYCHIRAAYEYNAVTDWKQKRLDKTLWISGFIGACYAALLYGFVQ